MQPSISKIIQKLFSKDTFCFEEVALELFAFQYTYNSVYRQFTDLLKINVHTIHSLEDIPFLPIEFFKTHRVLVENAVPQKIFESSGTTGPETSKHYVPDLNLYRKSFETCFQQFYGNIEEWVILALLPSYLERDTSSLVFMADDLIKHTRSTHSGFYLHNLDELSTTLKQLKNDNQKTMLIGVTFALLDFAEQFPMDLDHVVIMETGGMKGRREELTREEVHTILRQKLQVPVVHSEYGMTELLSQAYSKGNGIFETPPWMKILKRDIYDPLNVSLSPGRGGLNVIDLANIYSCPFIATQDLVDLKEDHTFEVLGRIDHSDIRGCNLMVSV